MSIHAAAAVLRPFVRAKLNPKAPVRPPELLNTGDCVKHHSPTSVTNAQTSTAFSVCVATPFPFCTWVYVPRDSAGPCMSSILTHLFMWQLHGEDPSGPTRGIKPQVSGLGASPRPVLPAQLALASCPALNTVCVVHCGLSPSSPTPTIPQGPGTCHLLCRAPHHARPAAHHCPESSSIGPSRGSVPISPKRL